MTALNADEVILVASAACEDVDAGLILACPTIFLSIGVTQLISEEEDTVSLECLPIFRFRDFDRESGSQGQANGGCWDYWLAHAKSPAPPRPAFFRAEDIGSCIG